MIASINQPAYLPWAGYFDRIVCSDIHVVLDHVQFEKNSLVNRNKIRIPTGTAYLTVPLQTKGRFGDLPICSLTTHDAQIWSKKHLKSLQANYARASHYREHIGFFEDLYEVAAQNTAFPPLLTRFMRYILDFLDIKTKVVFSSEMELTSKKSDLVLEICEKVGANEYLSGPFGREYLDVDSFKTKNIKVRYHSFTPQPYSQCWKGFESHLSIVDMIMNLSPDEIRAAMKKGREVCDV